METTTFHFAMPHCPFCKADGIIIECNYAEDDEHEEDVWYHPECSNCPCSWSESYKTIQEALGAWNKRI